MFSKASQTLRSRFKPQTFVNASRSLHSVWSTPSKTITYPRQGLDLSLPNSSLQTICDIGPDRKLVILGYGSIGEGILPLVLRHFNMPLENITIITADCRAQEALAAKSRFGVNAEVCALTPSNYESVLSQYLSKKPLDSSDLLINVSVDVSSLDMMQFCHERNILYVDTVIEPWAGNYFNPDLTHADRSNYAFRESLLSLRNTLNSSSSSPSSPRTSSSSSSTFSAGPGPTMVSCHGANPGMVSHFVKRALCDIARDTGYLSDNAMPENVGDQQSWARLARDLGVKTVHIAEFDSQQSKIFKTPNEFANTWSVDGFISEGYGQPAELGWGTHETEMPHDGNKHKSGRGSSIYLNQCGLSTRVRTWTPAHGSFLGYLVTHNEAVTISDYLTLLSASDANISNISKNSNDLDQNEVIYRPTVHYAYRPCSDAVLSVEEFLGRNFVEQERKRVMLDDIVQGMDELGVLLCGHEKNAYWFGSQLEVGHARSLVENNQATSLQVTATALAGIAYAIKNPNLGIVECEEMDHEFVLDVIEPYVAPLYGEYTQWNPLQGERGNLWKEKCIDGRDPWLFQNIRVMDANVEPNQRKENLK